MGKATASRKVGRSRYVSNRGAARLPAIYSNTDLVKADTTENAKWALWGTEGVDDGMEFVFEGAERHGTALR